MGSSFRAKVGIHLMRRRGAALLVGVLVASTAAAGCNATDPYRVEGCTRDVPGAWSVARVWDEQLLGLIRQVVPAPTEHARNLFHTSAAMWDAWAAYEHDGRRLLRDREADRV